MEFRRLRAVTLGRHFPSPSFYREGISVKTGS